MIDSGDITSWQKDDDERIQLWEEINHWQERYEKMRKSYGNYCLYGTLFITLAAYAAGATFGYKSDRQESKPHSTEGPKLNKKDITSGKSSVDYPVPRL